MFDAMIVMSLIVAQPYQHCLIPDESVPANARALAAGEICKKRALPRLNVLTPRQVTDLKRQIADTFKDPDSAVFRLPAKTTGAIVCGLVNAKNSYGGYIGYELFDALVDTRPDGGLKVVMKRVADDSNRAEISKDCHRAGYRLID